MINTKELSNILQEVKILYIEDDLVAQEETLATLSRFSKNILVASDGKEALDHYENNEIDLVISDIEIPFIDGISLIKHIRKTNISVPIIMVSAHLKNEYLFSCSNLHTQAYILKPISFEKLKDALYKVANYLNLTSNVLVQITQTLQYNKNQSLLIENDIQQQLNNKEKLLLDLLLENKNKIVSYAQIEQCIWYDFNEVMSQSALRTIIKNLRKKSSTNFIENISGSGYIIKINLL